MALLVIDTSLNENQGQTVLGQREGHGRLQNTNSGLLLVGKTHTHYREIQQTCTRVRPLSNAEQ